MNDDVLSKCYMSKFGFVIPKSVLTEDQLFSLKNELRGKPLQDTKYGQFNQVDLSFPLYTETQNKLYIPKMYGFEKFGIPKKQLSNYAGTKWNREIKFTGNLYQHQKDASRVMLKELVQGKGGGVLSLMTGGGKSITGIYLLSRLQRKAIIIVNKIPLMKQWETEIQSFLPNAKVGIIQGQANVDVHDKDIIIAMLQSLAKIDYPAQLFEDIGVCLVDECHNTSSKVFSRVLAKMCCRYTIGLTATPQRSDGCEYVFKWHLGDVLYKSISERKGLPPLIYTIKVDTDEYKEFSNTNKITGQKQIMYTSMISDLITMEKRNTLIIEVVKHMVTTESRRILVLSERREHVKRLKEKLDMDNTVSFTYGLFVGQMKMKDLAKSKACQVILATYQAFGEGVSEKDLDTLVLVTPKKYIGHLKSSTKNESGKLEQIVGRIFRKEHTNKNPMILDIQDNFSVYKRQSAGRNIFYKNHLQNASFVTKHVVLDDYSISDLTIDCLKDCKQKGGKYPKIETNVDSYCLLE